MSKMLPGLLGGHTTQLVRFKLLPRTQEYRGSSALIL